MTDMALLGTLEQGCAPWDGQPPSSLCIQVLGFKTEGGHCKDKGSNVEGKENLKSDLVSKKLRLSATICINLICPTYFYILLHKVDMFTVCKGYQENQINN